MKYLVTESQRDKVIFTYLDNQDFIKIDEGVNIYFVNSENDEYAQIRFITISSWCTISSRLMREIATFFSLDNSIAISAISRWVESKLGVECGTIEVAQDIIIRYY